VANSDHSECESIYLLPNASLTVNLTCDTGYSSTVLATCDEDLKLTLPICIGM